MTDISTTYKQVVDFFKKHRRQRFYLREISKEVGIDPGNLSRTLGSLVDKNILVRVKVGNKVYFSLKHGALNEGKEFDILESDEVKEYLRGIKDELIKLTQNLVRIPSVSGVDPEEKIADFISKKAQEYGLFPQVIAIDRRRPNLVVDLSRQVDKTKPYFLLVGHMDTIGVGEIDNWRYYPFSAHQSGGRIYGRGVIDMKAGIACELLTMKLIHDLKIDLPVTPRILLVSNEEGGSTASPIFDVGMEHLIKEGFVDGIGAIYGYGGSYNIGIGHRGVLRIKISTHGEAVHTGSVKWQRKEKGANAVTAMAEILLALENIDLPKIKHPCFPNHGNVITPGTMILHGGTAVSTVPDFCETVVDIRYVPGLPIKDVYSDIKEVVEKISRKRGIRVELARFVNISAVALSTSEDIVGVLSKACETVYKKEPGARGTGPANESFMLIKRGIPTVVFGPLGGGAHADNEFVNVKSLVKTIEVYLLSLSTMMS